MNVLISGCLLGINCKYNGGNNLVDKLTGSVDKINFIPICPEQLGGLTTPRPPSEIRMEGSVAKVVSNKGIDVTEQFTKGAEESLKIAKLYDCKYAILKERSPSCGSTHIYNGSFQGKVKPGIGMTAVLLEQHGIKVYSEENFEELLNKL